MAETKSRILYILKYLWHKSYQYSFSTRKRIYKWEDLNVTVWI